MDTFFRRHFKRKDVGLAAGGADAGPCRQRRPSVAVPTSKARRRSSAGLPSSSLAQRRRSSVQLQGVGSGEGLGRAKTRQRRQGCTAHGGQRRRRSSTTAPGLNPRFAVSRRKVGKLRTIDAHLLGPSMLLASLIQMAEEDDEQEGEVEVGAGLQVEVRGGTWRTFSRSSSLHSDGDDDSIAGSISEDSLASDREEATPVTPGGASPDPPPDVRPSAPPDHEPPAPRPLIRAPRCLRRNSSQFQIGGGSAHPPPADSTPPGCCRSSGQKRRRRVSTVSKAGGPWPGRGGPPPGRKTSTYLQGCRGAGALSPAHYDSHLESWSSFLLYVTPSPCPPSHRCHRGPSPHSPESVTFQLRVVFATASNR